MATELIMIVVERVFMNKWIVQKEQSYHKEAKKSIKIVLAIQYH